MKKTSFILIASLILINGYGALAQTTYYWNATSGNYNTLSNWRTDNFGGSVTPSVLPTSSDRIIVGNGSGNATITLNISDTVRTIIIQGSGQIFINTSNSSVLSVKDSLKSVNTNGTGGGSATLKLWSTGTTRLIGGTTNGVGKLPNITITKNSGDSVRISGYVTMGGSTTLAYTSGVIKADSGSIVNFYFSNTITGNFTLYNVEFQGTSGTHTFNPTIRVDGYLKFSGSGVCTVNGTGTFNLYGNLDSPNSNNSTAVKPTIAFKGSNKQTYSFTAGWMGVFTVGKSADSVKAAAGTTFLNVYNFRLDSGTFVAPSDYMNAGGVITANTTIFNHTGGVFCHNNATVNFYSVGTNVTYTVDVLSSTRFYNVGCAPTCPAGNCSTPIVTTATGDTVKAENNLTHSNGSVSGNWRVKRNFIVGSSAAGGLGNIIMSGDSSATYTFSGGSAANIVVNKGASANVNPAGGTTSLTAVSVSILSGNFKAPTGTLTLTRNYGAGAPTFSAFVHSGGTFDHNSGTVSFTQTSNGGIFVFDVLSSTRFNNVTLAGIPGSGGLPVKFSCASGDTVRIVKEFSHSQGIINGGYWEVYGNLNVGTNGGGGDGAVILAGDSTVTYSYTGGSTANLYINKSGSAAVNPKSGTTALIVVSLNIEHGAFKAPSGTLSIGKNYIAFGPTVTEFKHSGGTFDHNNGMVTFNPLAHGGTYIVDVLTSTHFYNITIAGIPSCGGCNNLTFNPATGDTVKVLKEFTHTGGILNGIWQVSTNLNVGGSSVGGTGIIILDGDSSVTYSYTGGSTANILINKNGSGTVTAKSGTTALSATGLFLLAGSFIAPTGNLTLTRGYGSGTPTVTIFSHTGGTFTHNSGTIAFNHAAHGGNITVDVSSSTVFYNVTFNSGRSAPGNNDPLTISPSGDTIKAAHNVVYSTGKVNTVPVRVEGDVTVLSTFMGGTAPLIFTGSSSQNFDLSGATGMFDGKIYLKKTSGNVTLLSALTMDGSGQTLTFIKGNLVTTGSNLLTIASGITVSGASDSSFVSGRVKKIGNAAFTFPIGKTSYYYNPIRITAPSSSTDAFTAEYFNTAHGTTTKDTSLTYISTCNYWQLDRTTGTSNVKVIMYWNSHTCDIYTLSTLRIAYLNSGTWKNVGTANTSGNTTAGNDSTISTVSNFGAFTIGKKSPLVYASTGIDKSICNGGSTTTGGSPSATGGLTPYTYSWSPATGLNSSSAANPTASATSTTTYILTVSDLDHSISKDTMLLTVYSNPGANSGNNLSICKGLSTIIGNSPAATGGSTPYSYSWSPFTGLNSSTLAQPLANPTATTTYVLTVTDAHSCIGKDTMTLTIFPIPLVNARPDTTVCVGRAATISLAVSSGTPSYTYSWSPSAGLSNPAIASPVVMPVIPAIYRITVTDANSCQGTDTIKVRLNTCDPCTDP